MAAPIPSAIQTAVTLQATSPSVRPFAFALTVDQRGLTESVEPVGESLGRVHPDGGEKGVGSVTLFGDPCAQDGDQDQNSEQHRQVNHHRAGLSLIAAMRPVLGRIHEPFQQRPQLTD